MKRITLVLLALAMLVSLATPIALADDGDETAAAADLDGRNVTFLWQVEIGQIINGSPWTRVTATSKVPETIWQWIYYPRMRLGTGWTTSTDVVQLYNADPFYYWIVDRWGIQRTSQPHKPHMEVGWGEWSCSRGPTLQYTAKKNGKENLKITNSTKAPLDVYVLGNPRNPTTIKVGHAKTFPVPGNVNMSIMQQNGQTCAYFDKHVVP